MTGKPSAKNEPRVLALQMPLIRQVSRKMQLASRFFHLSLPVRFPRRNKGGERDRASFALTLFQVAKTENRLVAREHWNAGSRVAVKPFIGVRALARRRLFARISAFSTEPTLIGHDLTVFHVSAASRAARARSSIKSVGESRCPCRPIEHFLLHPLTMINFSFTRVESCEHGVIDRSRAP